MAATAVAGCPGPSPTTDVDGGARDAASQDAPTLADAAAPDASSAPDAASTLDASAPLTTADELVTAMASVACGAAYECAAADLGFAQQHLSMGHCLTATRGLYASLLTDPAVAFDAAMAGRCLSALDAAVCISGQIPDDTAWPVDCRAALHGTLATGASCARTAECTQGICSCAGVCVDFAQRGASCAAAPCDAGLRCTAAGICDADTSARPGVGQACDALGGCDGALRCSGGICRTLRGLRQAGVGDACVNAFDGGNVDPATQCGLGLFCDFDHGSVCAANPSAGESCGGQAVCPQGYACQGSPQTCAAVQSEGADCFDPSACVPEDVCIVSVCTPRQPLGGTCGQDEECFSRRCAPDGRCALPERRFCP
ncbi:MAG: hypothetical protein U0234_19985 [Sandaracinus sp.]